MRKLILLMLMCLCAAPAMAQMEALTIVGAGVQLDATNNSTMTAFGGLNVYVSKNADLQVLNRTLYRWTNNEGKGGEVQSIETYLISRKTVYHDWYVNLGSGLNVEIKDDADQTRFAILAEVGRRLYTVDLFFGINVASVEGQKYKHAYLGLSLN